MQHVMRYLFGAIVGPALRGLPSLVVASAGLVFSPPLSAADAVAVRADAGKILALDPRLFAGTRDVRLVMGRVEKEPRNPLFTADRPWENSLNNLYPNVVFDPARRCFRLWYKCVLADKEAIAKMMPPATVHDVGWFLLYAESADGVTWTKPDLGLIGFDGSLHTNIVARDTPNVGVMFDPHDADAARRCKMLYDVGLGQLRVRFSADGLRWSEPQTPAGFTAYTGDTHNNAFWDERLGKYVAVTRFYLGERLVARSESSDFLKWEKTQLALRSTLAEGRVRQLYCMPAFAYGSGYLGFLMVYNAGTDRTVDCELAWSPDTVHWRRVLPGTPLIPRGPQMASGRREPAGEALSGTPRLPAEPQGSYDGGCIYAQAGPPLLCGGRLLVFYGGSAVVHRGWKRHCLPCLAYLRPDGFAAYEPTAPDAAGTLVTNPLRCAGQPLQISADAQGGSVRVAVLDDQGHQIAASQSVESDVTDAEVRWADGVSFESLRGRTVRLRLELCRAKLYAVRGVELVDESLPSATESAAPAQPLTGPPKLVRQIAAFDNADEGWQGFQRAERQAADDASGGFLRVTRADGNAFAFAAAQASAGRFVGNLQAAYGGRGVTISFRVRSPEAAALTQVELFARDIAQWSYNKLPAPGKDWTAASVTLCYDWSDEQARAAGWQSAINAFSWRETVQNVGKVVIGPLFQGTPTSFDLDDFTIQTAGE